MLSKRKSMMRMQNAGLIFMAAFLIVVIFIADLNIDNNIAVACLYIVVILYSWLLPGKYASVYTAAICTLLIFLAVIHNKEMEANSNDLSNLNMIVSLVVIWTSVTLVFIAKSSFSSLEGTNEELSKSSDLLLEKVIKLDIQQEELSTQKTQLENLNADLVIKNQQLERFTSIASHDLQEPLRTIGNMTQLIDKKYYSNFDEQGKKILDYVTKATGRMTTLVKGLLEFSRIGNKREVEKIDCQELVRIIVMDFDATLKAVNGTIKFNDLPHINGNSIELRMLFQNLISNGLKFRKPNISPVIEISSRISSTHVEFCVTDNGIGIDEANYDKIFFIYQRLHPLEEYEGSGLGLAYCRKIVELHGGKIWIDSKIEKGSSFYFTLRKEI